MTAGGPSPTPPTPPLPADVRHVAIICPTWVGDTVMATPVLKALRHHRPQTRLTAIVRPGLAPLLAGLDTIDAIVEIDPRGVTGPLRAAAALRRLDADVTLLLPNSMRTALAARLARTPRRIGYARDGRRPLLTHALPVEQANHPVPATTYYARLTAFALAVDAIDETPALATTPDEEAAADTLLDGLDAPFVLLNPGANRADKRWPADRFAALADRVHREHGLAAVVTGAPREAALAAEVGAIAATPIIDLVERGIDLGGLKAVARRAAVMITNDTGPRHIAAALNTPVVTLFGPTDHRWTTLPTARERCLLAEPFLPEELVADRHADICVIERIPVEDAAAAASQLIADRAAGAGSHESGAS